MALNPFGFVLGSLQAQREGVNDPQARRRLGFIGGLFGSPVTGLALTTVLARREADAATVSAPTPGGTPTSTILVEVPNVVGLSITQAQQELQAFGLQVQRRDVRSSTTPKDKVIEQDPKAKTPVPEGNQVTLTVSQGFPLPDVTGLPVADARQQLERLGLQVQPVNQHSTTISEGNVISEDPKAGTFVSAGGEVRLIVSQGPLRMPSFIGRGFQDARDELQDLDLRAERIQAETSDEDKAPDEVVGQDPSAGTPVAPETPVKLTVNPVELPSLKGQKFKKARETLQNLDLRVRREEREDSADKGKVLDQDPEPGPVAPESLVTLTVSTGPSQPAEG